jgi:hypothetical protein
MPKQNYLWHQMLWVLVSAAQKPAAKWSEDNLLVGRMLLMVV